MIHLNHRGLAAVVMLAMIASASVRADSSTATVEPSTGSGNTGGTPATPSNPNPNPNPNPNTCDVRYWCKMNQYDCTSPFIVRDGCVSPSKCSPAQQWSPNDNINGADHYYVVLNYPCT